ncbi:hypothetical protein J0H58_02430 [bacterium]|nr:hypothetical protein [bacterium]
MRPRLLLVPVLLVAAGGVALTQSPGPVTPMPVYPDFRVQVAPTPVASTLPPRPAEKSIDKMMDQLDAVRAQKAELERQEQALVKEIRERLEKQGDRARQLGIGSGATSGPAAISPSAAVSPGSPPQGSFGSYVGLFGGN